MTTTLTTELRKLPDLAASQGMLRLEATGVCGSDPVFYRRDLTPRALGHEVVGTIVELGRVHQQDSKGSIVDGSRENLGSSAGAVLAMRCGLLADAKGARVGRQRALGTRAHRAVDRDLCQGHGQCVESAPDVFVMDEEGLAIILPYPEDAPGLREWVRDAALRCPVEAILFGTAPDQLI